MHQPTIALSGGASPPPEISSRECRLLERLAGHVHFVSRYGTRRLTARVPRSTAKGIALVRLERLKRAGLVGTTRIHGRLAVVPTPAGERLVAERRERRRERRAGVQAPVKWWL
jgi:hypothetical protein